MKAISDDVDGGSSLQEHRRRPRNDARKGTCHWADPARRAGTDRWAGHGRQHGPVRDIEPRGRADKSQLDAARAKIAAGFVYALLARVSIISEGSFGLHPHVSFVAFGREPVLMIDREAGLELTGYDASPETNFGPAVARDLDEAMSFADRARFPTHGLIVIGCKAEPPAPALFLNKEIVNGAALEAVAKDAIRICGAAFVEIDMRDHQNPTRMAAIERATRDVARRFHSRCLNCDDLGIRRD